MLNKKLDWEDLKFLGCIATYKTVRASARQLGVHHSTVSRRIDSLEHAAGTRLFSRTPEGYVLTEAGTLLASTAIEIQQKVTRAERIVSGGDKTLSGRLHISMPEPLSVHVFAKHLVQFRKKYPQLELSISSEYELVDLSRQEADIAIRATNAPAENLFGKRLFSYHIAGYAATEYLESVKCSDTEKGAIWIGWDGSFDEHPRWKLGLGCDEAPVWGNFPDINMQLQLAKAGQGMAQLPCFLGDAEPGLVRINHQQSAADRDFWLLTHRDLKNSSKVRAFMKFAEETMYQYKDAFQGKLKNR